MTYTVGHGIVDATRTGSDHLLPHWPAEVHYTGVGHGQRPAVVTNSRAFDWENEEKFSPTSL